MAFLRALLVALLGSAALVVAGCGSSSAASNTDSISSLAPKDAGAFVVVETDQTSAQWKNTQALLAKIPGGEKALNSALSQIGGAKGVDFAKDVAPAFGKQLVVVVPSGAKDPILLVKPDDSKKLDALLAKGTKPSVNGDVDGWTAIATTQKELDSYKAALDKGSCPTRVRSRRRPTGCRPIRSRTGISADRALSMRLAQRRARHSRSQASASPVLLARRVLRTRSARSGSQSRHPTTASD